MGDLVPTEKRWIAGMVIVLVMSGLVYTGSVPSSTGVPIIVAVGSGLGLYERRERRRQAK